MQENVDYGEGETSGHAKTFLSTVNSVISLVSLGVYVPYDPSDVTPDTKINDVSASALYEKVLERYKDMKFEPTPTEVLLERTNQIVFLNSVQKVFSDNQDSILKCISNYLFVVSSMHAVQTGNRQVSAVWASVVFELKSLTFTRRRERFCRVSRPREDGSPIKYDTSEWVTATTSAMFVVSGNQKSKLSHTLENNFKTAPKPIVEVSEEEWLSASKRKPNFVLPHHEILVKQSCLPKVYNLFNRCWQHVKHEIKMEPSFQSDNEFNSFMFYLRNLYSSSILGTPSEGKEGKKAEAPKPGGIMDLKRAVEGSLRRADNRNGFAKATEAMLSRMSEPKEKEVLLRQDLLTTDGSGRKIALINFKTNSTLNETRSLLFNLSGWLPDELISAFASVFLGSSWLDDRDDGNVVFDDRLFFLTKALSKVKRVRECEADVKSKVWSQLRKPPKSAKGKGKGKGGGGFKQQSDPSDNLRYDSKTDKWNYHGNVLNLEEPGFLDSSNWMQFREAIFSDSAVYDDSMGFTFMLQLLHWMLVGETEINELILGRFIHYPQFTNKVPGDVCDPGTEMYRNDVFNKSILDNFFQTGYLFGSLVVHGEDKMYSLVKVMFNKIFNDLETSASQWRDKFTRGSSGYWESLQLDWFKRRCWDLNLLAPIKEGDRFSWKKALHKLDPDSYPLTESPKDGEEEEETITTTPPEETETTTPVPIEPLKSNSTLDDFYYTLENLWLNPHVRASVITEEGTRKYVLNEREGEVECRTLTELYALHYVNGLYALPLVNAMNHESGLAM